VSFTTETGKAEFFTCPLRSNSDRQPSKCDLALWLITDRLVRAVYSV
jgi:hypothetical protein